MADIVENNIHRFSGYAQLYHGYRPEVPESVIDILIAYLGRRPDVVVDLGCGTGLSSFLWGPVAGRVVGVEPNDDMRHQAMEENSRRGLRQMEFVNGLSTAIPLEDGVADVVTCSQSFHWMNPQPTLAEIHRILKPGGFFAAYDCDWPPSCSVMAEQAYDTLIEAAEGSIQKNIPAEQQVHKWPKHEHLQQIVQSGLFTFTKEVVFHVERQLTAQEFIGIGLSQGSVQTVLKHQLPDMVAALPAFEQTVYAAFAEQTRRAWLCYRMRIGMK
ncbi:MAG: methyltransferase domain-containing protein [Alicyclobacillaceae bacterium]|nr:methyltransferase domain-containing protein [Alicyclobacillaceae bacterium]